MITYSHSLSGSLVDIHYVQDSSDLDRFEEFCRMPRRIMAVDTETTGLDIYSAGFGLRLVQFGDEHQAYVLRYDLFKGAIKKALAELPLLLFHNATFDLLVLDHFGVIRLEESFPKAHDTRTLAHLLDPRADNEGGIGHHLKGLSTVYVSGDAPDSQKELHAIFRKRGWKLKTGEGWAKIEIDNPTYVLYAGLDVILTARLFEVIGPACVARGYNRLIEFERKVSALLAILERRGMLVDVEWARNMVKVYDDRRDIAVAKCAEFGIENVESTAQVIKALEGSGAVLLERTPKGAPKVDKAVLEALTAAGNPVAATITEAKQALKYRTAYVDSVLELRDARDRIHPKINGLQARTARMSVSRPPFQQLPSGDWMIRRMILADRGKHIISCDYAQVEMRVLAALAEEEIMKQAIADGVSLHVVTAKLMFGDDYTPLQYKLSKNTGFGRVFGGGAKTLARQAGVTMDVANSTINLYDKTYPGLKRYSRKLVERARSSGSRSVTTPSGRYLPLDGDRLYAATNYMVQSTARDVLCQALLELDAAGLSDHILLPIHDEVLGQADVGDAQEVADAIAEVMSMDFMGVRLDAEPDVYGPSWGHGYGATE